MKAIQKIGAVVVMGLFLVATPALAATGDYVSYWGFDDATGRSIGDTGGQNGVMTGASSSMGWAGGKSGTALGMDGTESTGVALPDAFLKGSQGSLSVWFKMIDLSDRNVIFSGKSTLDNNIFVLLSVDHDGRPQLLFRTDPSASNRLVQGGAILNKNEWYHLVLVATGQSYQMYINGEEKIITGENIGRWFPDFTNHPLSYRIGASIANPMIASFNGMIDEMRIYNRPLTADEVGNLYADGNAGTPTLPLALRPKPVPAVVQSPEVPVIPVVSTGTPSLTVIDVTAPRPIPTFSRNLSVGSRGDDVVNLQLVLISRGHLAAGLSSGYFGQLTKSALVKLQSTLGLPSTGFFGPMTRAKIATM
jgi:hypothetical protein